MKKLTQTQKEFLFIFFKDENYAGWKNIANSLLENGKCIVAGKECIWKGHIGNFIKTKNADGFIDCIEYSFDIDEFLSSEWFKETHNNEISILSSKKIEIEQRYKEICDL